MVERLLASIFRWEDGRQGTGYQKMLLARIRWPLPADAYLLKFAEGQEIAPHRDEVTIGKHFRINIILKAAKKGGEFQCTNPIIDWPRLKLFRPDISEHSVSKVIEGNRYLLSVGWVINK